MYTREELISICEAAIVPVEKWSNRDTPLAQEKVGIAWLLLKAGCRFEVTTEASGGGPHCVTDDYTIWLYISAPTFGTFESGSADEDRRFYLPTRKQLAERQGRDWY